MPTLTYTRDPLLDTKCPSALSLVLDASAKACPFGRDWSRKGLAETIVFLPSWGVFCFFSILLDFHEIDTTERFSNQRCGIGIT